MIQNEEQRKKASSYKINVEKRKLRNNFKDMDEIDKEEKAKTDKIINNRRKLRERFLRSTKVGNLKLIETARQDMLRYEISLKLKQEENERD